VKFIKTTFLGGLVLIVPLAVLLISLTYLVALLVSLNNSIAKHLPQEVFGHPAAIVAIAIATIVGLCFLAGLLLKTGLGAKLASKLDTFLDDKLPVYGILRKLTQRFTGTDGLEFAPAEVDLHGNETRVLAFVVEELPDDRYAVFVPSSPALTIGQVYLLPKDKVRLLETAPKRTVDAITQWGSGTKLVFEEAES
jgi:uncharacterized membrane protein